MAEASIRDGSRGERKGGRKASSRNVRASPGCLLEIIDNDRLLTEKTGLSEIEVRALREQRN